MDPFAILGIVRTFDVDLGAVERTHRELSRALHPDKFVGVSQSERTRALRKAVEVNEAWLIVRDPISRADALLRLNGVSARAGEEPKPSPEFLMDMLDQREALSDAKRQRDLAAVTALAANVAARAHGVERELSIGFASNRAHELVGKVGELRFYRRFLDEVSAIEDELAA